MINAWHKFKLTSVQISSSFVGRPSLSLVFLRRVRMRVLLSNKRHLLLTDNLFVNFLTVSSRPKFKDYCYKSCIHVCSKLWMTHKTMLNTYTPTMSDDCLKLSQCVQFNCCSIKDNANQCQKLQMFPTLIWNIWKFYSFKSVTSIRQYGVTISPHAKSNCIWDLRPIWKGFYPACFR